MSGRSVVVIGGGVIGVSSAYYLALDGWEVTLLEKGEICAGSSYGNAGLIVPSHLVPLAAPGRLVAGRQVDAELREPLLHQAAGQPRARAVALALPGRVHPGSRAAGDAAPPAAERGEPRALPRVRREGARLRLPPVRLDDRVLHARGAWRHGREEAKLLREGGATVEVLDGAAARSAEPALRAGVVGALYCREDALLVPDRFVKGLAKLAESAGVRITDRHRGDRLPDEAASRVTEVETTRGAFSAGTVVLAAGRLVTGRGPRARAPRADPARQGLQPHVPPPGASPDDSPPARRGPLLGHADGRVPPVRRHARARRNGPLDQPPPRGGPPAEGARLHRGRRATWSSWRSGEASARARPTGCPSSAARGGSSNLVVAAGHAMVGMSMGPVTGKLVAQLAADGATPPADVRLLDPDRFG